MASEGRPGRAARVLWVATKSPWPPFDGGRLLMWNTLRALAGRGLEITLVAPSAEPGERAEAGRRLEAFCRPELLAAAPLGPLAAVGGALLRGRPYTVARHSLPAVRRRVASLVAGGGIDLVHVEQVQAFGSAEPAMAAGLPVLLRAQNVESELWAGAARATGRRLLAREARRVARWEGRAVARSAAAVALTWEDAQRLVALAGGREVEVIPAPFEAELPAAADRLAGDPAVVLFGSAGWMPNSAGARSFLERAWPAVGARLPGARLHCFGPLPKGLDAPAGLEPHAPPASSREAFAPGSVLVVPLEIASGVRIKILEAWARGVPVVATPAAARGLGATAGRELLVAEDGEAFAAALARLAEEEGLAASLTAAGREILARRHAPERVGSVLAELYASIAGTGSGSGAGSGSAAATSAAISST